MSTAYEPQFYVIIEINRSSIKARRINDDKLIHRDASHFKLANALLEDREAQSITERKELYNNEEAKEMLGIVTEAQLETQRKYHRPSIEDTKEYCVDTQENEEYYPEEQGEQPAMILTDQQDEQELRRSSRIRKPVEKLNL